MKIAIMLCLLVLSAEVAHASFDDYQRFRKGNLGLELETQYFTTDANYSSAGNAYQALSFNQSYEIFNVYLKTRYDLSKRSSWYASLDVANATSHGVTTTRSNSSLTGALLGFAYRPYDEALDMITDFNVVVPFQKINENTDSVINSEGVIEATGLLRLQKEFSKASVFGYIGGTFRQGRSALLPWGAGLEAAYPAWGWGGKVFGYQSITDDPDTDNKIQRTLVTDRVDGGSLKFYAVNPAVIDSEAYLKFKFKNTWTLAVGGGATLTGASMAAGYHAGVSLKYVWDTEPSYYLKPTPGSAAEDALSSEKKVPKFKEEIDDGVDQKLFQKRAQ